MTKQEVAGGPRRRTKPRSAGPWMIIAVVLTPPVLVAAAFGAVKAYHLSTTDDDLNHSVTQRDAAIAKSTDLQTQFNDANDQDQTEFAD